MSGAIPPLGQPFRKRRAVAPFPLIASESEKSGLTGTVTTTTLFTPATDGIYRATMILWVTTGGDPNTVTANLLHTDRVGSVTKAIHTAISVAATTRVEDDYLFEGVAGQPVQISLPLTGIRVASVWALETVIEQLA